MAVDSWMPHRFAALSDRLTTHNGIVLMGAASLAALLYTGGDVGKLVVMYSINVFLTFSLSLFGMARKTIAERKTVPCRTFASATSRRSWSGSLLCATILVITAVEKFTEGGWLTLVVTARRRRALLPHPPSLPHGARCAWLALPRRAQHRRAARTRRCRSRDTELPTTACVLVSSYDGVGIHTVLNVFRSFPNHFKNLVFVSVGVIDSGGFKGGDSRRGARGPDGQATLKRYCSLATTLEMSRRPTSWRSAPTPSPRPRKSVRGDHGRVPRRDVHRRQGHLRAREVVPALPAQRDRDRDPEAPLLDGRDDGRAARQGSVMSEAKDR